MLIFFPGLQTSDEAGRAFAIPFPRLGCFKRAIGVSGDRLNNIPFIELKAILHISSFKAETGLYRLFDAKRVHDRNLFRLMGAESVGFGHFDFR